jgi:hypothetical protein
LTCRKPTPVLGTGSPIARRQGTAGIFDCEQGALGRRDERANGERPHQPKVNRSRPGTCAGDHARSSRAPIRTSSSLRAIDSKSMWSTRSLSGTAYGIFWPRVAPARSASAYSRVVTVGKRSSARGRIAPTRTRGISFATSTRSACADRNSHAIPSRPNTERYHGARSGTAT